MIDVEVCASHDVIGLPEYLDYLRWNLDVHDDASILESAPQLAALARNRRFIAEYVAEKLAEPSTFQPGNEYGGPVFLLGGGAGYVVRAVVWTPETEVETTPSNFVFNIYHDESKIAHNHNFSLLTVGYWGRGYETELFECDPASIDARVGKRIALEARGRRRLSEGTMMYYRHHRDFHIQCPADDYSISLNLIVNPPGVTTTDQVLVDATDGTIIQVTGGANDFKCRLMTLAGALRDPLVDDKLAIIAERHKTARVRDAARVALSRRG